jgi:uncharacterized protein YecE (DUF72 family)
MVMAFTADCQEPWNGDLGELPATIPNGRKLLPGEATGRQMLPYYAERLSTVEINYTYYRTPNKKILAGWNTATPERFEADAEAPKRIA